MVTNDAGGQVWASLSLLMSRSILERRYRQRHGGELSAGKAKEIVAHLDQARQYFRSAESAGVLAGPLEQYYGVLALSRALILFLTPRLRESGLRRGHGLTATLPNDRLEDIEAHVQSGTFDELLDATQNSETFAADGINGVNEHLVQNHLRRPSLESHFKFLDLLSRIIELKPTFEAAFDRCACCHYGRSLLISNLLTLQVVDLGANLAHVDALKKALLLPTDSTSQVVAQSVTFSFKVDIGPSVPKTYPNIHPLGGLFPHATVEAFSAGWSLNRLTTYFAASHVLSMIVRYYPTKLAKLHGHDTDDRLLPVTDNLRLLVQSEFPRLCLYEFLRKQ